jgi:hypothetical protein
VGAAAGTNADGAIGADFGAATLTSLLGLEVGFASDDLFHI